jgi:hypothetical protein
MPLKPTMMDVTSVSEHKMCEMTVDGFMINSLVPFDNVDVAKCERLFAPHTPCFGCANLLEEFVADAECFTYVYLRKVCTTHD